MSEEETLTCSVYIRNKNIAPSDYYRIVQYIEEIEKRNISVTIYESLSDKEYSINLNSFKRWWHKLYQLYLYIKILFRRRIQFAEDIRRVPDIVFIQRETIPKLFPILMYSMYKTIISKSRVIWDFDDDIFEAGEISKRETNTLLEYSSVIIGISSYSANLIPDDYVDKYVALPTTDYSPGDQIVFKSIEDKLCTYDRVIRVIWVGTVSNLKYLDGVIEALDEAAIEIQEKSNKVLELDVVCNVEYKRKCKGLQIKNIKWRRDVAKEKIRDSHIGIMPLSDGKIQKGKGAFKLIQYLSEGLPVVASNNGFGKEVISSQCGYLAKEKEDWIASIVELATNEATWKEKAYSAYHRYCEKYDIDNNLNVLVDLMKKGNNGVY